jgi:putative ubiquitin-RnfH superfamily antitoxin RatB of RatAB toxin-antitoxin module
VVFATPERQELVTLVLRRGATIGEAIEESGLQAFFSQVDFDELQAGVWGRIAERSVVLRDGDRVELYRPLARDPRDARRALARVQRSGSSS